MRSFLKHFLAAQMARQQASHTARAQASPASRAQASPAVPRLGDIMAPEANSFGVLRLAMALLVLVSHSYLYTSGTQSGEPLHAWTGHSLGQHAVQVFFILSGILVAQSFERSRSIVDFATARILRIFPALIVCVLLTALVLGPTVSRLNFADYLASRELLAYIAKTLLLITGNAPLPGVFETLPLAHSVNTSLWTLKYEVLCYMCLALAGLVGLFNRRWRNQATFALICFVILIFAGAPNDPASYGFADHFRYFALYFGTGVLTYTIKVGLPVHGFPLLPLFTIFLLALGGRFGELATALFLAYATVWLASKSFGPLRGLCNKLDLSFGVYIYAGPIEQALIWAFPNMHALGIAAMTVALALPLALVSWVVIEWPALQLRHRLRAPETRHESKAATHPAMRLIAV